MKTANKQINYSVLSSALKKIVSPRDWCILLAIDRLQDNATKENILIESNKIVSELRTGKTLLELIVESGSDKLLTAILSGYNKGIKFDPSHENLADMPQEKK